MRNRGNAIVPRKIYGLRQQAVTTERSGVRLDNAFRAACAALGEDDDRRCIGADVGHFQVAC